MMPYALLHWWVWAIVVSVLLVFALLRGARDEKIAATSLMLGWLATMAVYTNRPGLQTEWGVFAVDVGLLGMLIFIAMTSTRYWPIFAASFQLLAVVIHLARIADPTFARWAYISAEIIFSYLLVTAIAVGTWGRWQDRLQFAMDDDPTPGAPLTRR